MNKKHYHAMPEQINELEELVSKYASELAQVRELLHQRTQWQADQQRKLQELTNNTFRKQCDELIRNSAMISSHEEAVHRLFVRVLTRYTTSRRQSFVDYLNPKVLLGDAMKSKLSKDSKGVVNSMEIICPYELNGVCRDEYCKYWHMETGFRQKISAADIKLGQPKTLSAETEPKTKENCNHGVLVADGNDDMSISEESDTKDHVSTLAKYEYQKKIGFDAEDEFISLPSEDDSVDGNSSSEDQDMGDDSDSSSHIDNVDENLPLHQLLRKRYMVEFSHFDDCSNHAIILLIISGHFDLVREQVSEIVTNAEINLSSSLYSLIVNLMSEADDIGAHEDLPTPVLCHENGKLSLHLSNIRKTSNGSVEYLSKLGETGAFLIDSSRTSRDIIPLVEDMERSFHDEAISQHILLISIPILMKIYENVGIDLQVFQALDRLLRRFVKMNTPYKFVLVPLLSIHIAFMRSIVECHPSRIMGTLELYLKKIPHSSILISQYILLFEDNLLDAYPVFDYVVRMQLALPGLE